MSAASTPTPTPALRRESPWRRNLAEFLSSKTAVVGLVVSLLLILAAALAPGSRRRIPMTCCRSTCWTRA